jgi:hypothetical protein
VYSPSYLQATANLTAVQKSYQSTIETAFANYLQFALTNQLGEDYVRSLFSNFTSQIISVGRVLLSNAENSVLSGSNTDTLLIGHSHHWSMLKQTKQYNVWTEQQKRDREQCKFLSKFSSYIYNIRLRKISPEDLIKVLKQFLAALESRTDILYFLTLLPNSTGGILPIATLLFHTHSEVRSLSASLLTCLESEPEGIKLISSTNSAFKRHY